MSLKLFYLCKEFWSLSHWECALNCCFTSNLFRIVTLVLLCDRIATNYTLYWVFKSNLCELKCSLSFNYTSYSEYSIGMNTWVILPWWWQVIFLLGSQEKQLLLQKLYATDKIPQYGGNAETLKQLYPSETNTTKTRKIKWKYRKGCVEKWENHYLLIKGELIRQTILI